MFSNSLRPLVSIIIPVFNNWRMTADCLRSMRAHLGMEQVEVIVVDNASTDETALRCPELGASLFTDRFTCITNPSNLNFAGACNRGALQARGDLLLFLNNDTLWCEDILPPLLRELEKPGIGCCGPLLLYPGDRIQHLGVTFLHPGKVIHAFRDFPRTHRVARIGFRLQAMTAAAMLIPARLFRDSGAFHEEYRNGYEDLDLCHRLGQQGLRPSVAPGAVLYHLEGQTEGRSEHHIHNFEVYTRRVGAGFGTDVDYFALRAGLRLKLNQWFEPYFVSNQKTHETFLARLEQQGPAAALEILDQEPCWEHGYTVLIDLLTRRGSHPEALTMAQERLRFCPCLETVDLILRLAKAAGDVETLTHYTAFRHRVAALGKDPGLARTARAMLKTAISQGREHLAAALQHWMNSHAS